MLPNSEYNSHKRKYDHISPSENLFEKDESVMSRYCVTDDNEINLEKIDINNKI